jgi:hypothetical protein
VDGFHFYVVIWLAINILFISLTAIPEDALNDESGEEEDKENPDERISSKFIHKLQQTIYHYCPPFQYWLLHALCIILFLVLFVLLDFAFCILTFGKCGDSFHL